MRIDKRLTLIGIMLVVLSMTTATQYATTKIGYTYSIVHPSNADIRFIGFDNSTDGDRVIRTASGTNNSNELNLVIKLGNWSENQNKTYTAAFGIVNEERFPVNITHVVVDTDTGVDYMKVWLHGKPGYKATDDDTSVLIWDMGAVGGIGNGSTAWQLATGNENAADMNGTNTETDFDDNAHVRYTIDDDVWAKTTVSDFVWVQISVDIPDAADVASQTGNLRFYFEATTLT